MFGPLKRHHLGGIYKGVQVEQILCFNSARTHLWHNLPYLYAFVHAPADGNFVEIETCSRNISD